MMPSALMLCAFLLLSLSQAFQSATKAARVDVSVNAWTLPTPTSFGTIGSNWYQSVNPTARKTSYCDDLPLAFSFEYDDWSSSDSEVQQVASPNTPLSPFGRVAKFATRFRRRDS
jgi:hypothetical protein